MIRFYSPTPNPAKVALFLEESGLTYELVPVDTSKGEQHQPSFRAVNPNGKVPAIVDTEGPGGKEAQVFDSAPFCCISPRKRTASSDSLPTGVRFVVAFLPRKQASGPSWDRPCISSLRPPTASTTPSTDIAAKRSATIVYSTSNSPAATTLSDPNTRSSTCPPGVGSIAPPV